MTMVTSAPCICLNQSRADTRPSPTPRYNGTLEYTGFSVHTLRENTGVQLQKDYTTGLTPGIPTIFGVLFNGVTGIMAGANMSGDLKNASESIPKGTMQVSRTSRTVWVDRVVTG